LFRWQFCELRRLFFEQHVKKYKEIQNKNFEFYVYLRKCMRASTINIAMIHWQVWLIILILVFLNTVRILAFSTSEVSSFIAWDAIILWGVALYVFYLRYRLMYLLKTIAGPATYVKYCQNRAGSAEEEEEEEEEAQKDEEEARHHEDSRIMSGFCCGKWKNTTTQQQSLFPFWNPSSITRGLQLALLLICLSIPLYIMELSDSIRNEPGGVKFLASFFIGTPAVLLLVLAIPPIIPRFVIVTSVASMSRPSQIRSTIEKFHRHARKAKHAVHGGHGHEHGHEEHEKHGHGHEHDEHEHEHEHEHEEEPGKSEHHNESHHEE